MIVLRPGLRIRFVHCKLAPVAGSFAQNRVEQEGVVNGAPYVIWHQAQFFVRIPVHLQETNENIDVSGSNVEEVYDET